MTRNLRATITCGGAALGLTLALAPLAHAEEGPAYVVLASTVPDFSVGELVEDSERLEIPQGGSLTLIDALGEIKVIKGPFLGRLRSDADDDAEPSFLADLANIVALADTADVALGMGRTSTPALGVSPWLVAFDLSLAEDLCVSPDGQLVFARGDGDIPATANLRFSAADGSAEALVAWGADDPLLRWPSELPPVDGQAYVIDYGAAPAPPEVTLHLTPASLDTDSHAAVWLARHGCASQAEAMVRRMALGG